MVSSLYEFFFPSQRISEKALPSEKEILMSDFGGECET